MLADSCGKKYVSFFFIHPFIFFSKAVLSLRYVEYVCAGPEPATGDLYEPAEPSAIMGEFVDEMLAMIANLKSTVLNSSSIRVCLVIDGDTLPAKQGTHRERSRRSFSQLKQARRLTRAFLGKPRSQPDIITKFRARFRGCAYGWIRWFSDLKNLLAEQLVARGVSRGFDVNGLEEYSVVVAPYESDPTCVWLADQARNSCIFFPDGDLLVYPFADAALVYVKDLEFAHSLPFFFFFFFKSGDH